MNTSYCLHSKVPALLEGQIWQNEIRGTYFLNMLLCLKLRRRPHICKPLSYVRLYSTVFCIKIYLTPAVSNSEPEEWNCKTHYVCSTKGNVFSTIPSQNGIWDECPSHTRFDFFDGWRACLGASAKKNTTQQSIHKQNNSRRQHIRDLGIHGGEDDPGCVGRVYESTWSYKPGKQLRHPFSYWDSEPRNDCSTKHRRKSNCAAIRTNNDYKSTTLISKYGQVLQNDSCTFP